MEFKKFQAQVDGGSVYSARDELRNIEQFLANYNRWIALKILEKKNNLLHILDFGAGIGTLAKQIYLIENIRPVCVEIDEYFKSELEELGYQTLSSTNEADLKFDLIYSSNVLEHIRDDESVLRELNGLLTETGELVLYLPAFQILYSDMDRNVGHFRRYSRKSISAKLQKNGYEIRKIEYCDCLGFLITLGLKFFRGGKVNNLIHPKSLLFYDRFIWPISKFLDTLGFKLFFGKNVLISAVPAKTKK